MTRASILRHIRKRPIRMKVIFELLWTWWDGLAWSNWLALTFSVGIEHFKFIKWKTIFKVIRIETAVFIWLEISIRVSPWSLVRLWHSFIPLSNSSERLQANQSKDEFHPDWPQEDHTACIDAERSYFRPYASANDARRCAADTGRSCARQAQCPPAWPGMFIRPSEPRLRTSCMVVMDHWAIDPQAIRIRSQFGSCPERPLYMR